MQVKSNMAYMLFYRRKDLTEFSTAADETLTTSANNSADAVTDDAENKSSSSDSEDDSGDAAEGSIILRFF